MKKKITIGIFVTLLIILSFSIYKYSQFNKNRLNIYTDRVLWLTINTQNSIHAITETSVTEEEFNRNAEELIINIYALQNVLESGEILLSGNGGNGSVLYNSLDGLKSVLKYDDKNIKNLQEIEVINRAINVLIERLQPYYGTGKNISKKEIRAATQLALLELKIIHVFH